VLKKEEGRSSTSQYYLVGRRASFTFRQGLEIRAFNLANANKFSSCFLHQMFSLKKHIAFKFQFNFIQPSWQVLNPWRSSSAL
jgi:hypothetical protein